MYVSKCEFSFKNSSLKTLVVFSAIFVADTKLIFRYDFVAPLTVATFNSYLRLKFVPTCYNFENNEIDIRTHFLKSF